MHNHELSADYVRRASARLKAIDVLFDLESWPDVVRESQEAVELALKGLLRASGIEPPRVHDVSDLLRLERDRLPATVLADVETLAEASRRLRRDRELAFSGAEDLTPSGFYSKTDAGVARDDARFVVKAVRRAVLGAE
jgi:HEPN domain-containing protein